MDCVTSHEVDRRYLFKSPVFEVETGSVGYSRIGGARSKGNKAQYCYSEVDRIQQLNKKPICKM